MTRLHDAGVFSLFLILIVVGLPCIGDEVAGADATDEAADDAVARYLQTRESLTLDSDAALELLSDRRSALAGAVFEVAGKIAGRSSLSEESGLALSFMLQVGDETIFVDTDRDAPPIRVGTRVQAILQFPENGGPMDHFVLREIAFFNDLPSDIRLALPKKEASEPPEPETETDAEAAAETEEQDISAEKETEEDNDDDGKPDEVNQGTIKNDRTIARPGTEYPELSHLWPDQEVVRTWMDWIGKQNPDLNEMQQKLIAESVLHYSDKFEIDHRLVFSMIKAESNFNPSCRSHAGAIGLCQLMPGTARSLGVKNPWNVQENIRGGVQYLAAQLNLYSDRSPYEQCVLGLACYNAGPNAVKRAGGIPDNGETPKYCRKVAELFYELWKSGMP
ncbi:MAG: lytic transglycosylase domain-containing protein [Armatimonadota bacterium]